MAVTRRSQPRGLYARYYGPEEHYRFYYGLFGYSYDKNKCPTSACLATQIDKLLIESAKKESEPEIVNSSEPKEDYKMVISVPWLKKGWDGRVGFSYAGMTGIYQEVEKNKLDFNSWDDSEKNISDGNGSYRIYVNFWE